MTLIQLIELKGRGYRLSRIRDEKGKYRVRGSKGEIVMLEYANGILLIPRSMATSDLKLLYNFKDDLQNIEDKPVYSYGGWFR